MNRVKGVSFVVRVAQGRRGQGSGVIERVATGAKEAFTETYRHLHDRFTTITPAARTRHA